jgi:DNA polymerase III epsilon subunit-like protein
MKHVMLDLETLGTGDHAAIVQIGACVFDSREISSTFRRNIYLGSENLGNIEGDTLRWWMGQSPDAIASVLQSTERAPLRIALEDFRSWLVGDRFAIWANSPSFDLRLLRQAYERCGLEPPWKFYQEMDHRTMKHLGRLLNVPRLQFEGTKHDALVDTINQARYLMAVLKELKL